MIPVAQTLKSEAWGKVADSATFDGLRVQMGSSPELNIWAEGHTLTVWETSLWRRVAHAAKRALYGRPLDLAVSIGFLLLKELAIRDLATICQSKVLGISASHIRPLLIHLDPAVET